MLALALLVLASCTSLARSDAQADLFAAVREDSVGGLKIALAAGAELNARGPGGQTALMAAALGGSPKSAAYLLKRGADATIGEQDGYTPLHGAAFQGRADVARVLLQDARVPNALHPDGFFPVHRACWGREQRHADTLRVFLENGEFERKTQDGKTLLEVAEGKGNAASLALLKDWGSAAEEL